MAQCRPEDPVDRRDPALLGALAVRLARQLRLRPLDLEVRPVPEGPASLAALAAPAARAALAAVSSTPRWQIARRSLDRKQSFASHPPDCFEHCQRYSRIDDLKTTTSLRSRRLAAPLEIICMPAKTSGSAVALHSRGALRMPDSVG